MFFVPCIRSCIPDIVNTMSGKVLARFNQTSATMHFGTVVTTSGSKGQRSKVKVVVE